MGRLVSEAGGRFCPICGRRAERYYEGLCEECYRRLHPLVEVPEEITVTMCKVCGAYMLGRKWVANRGPDPIKHAVEAVVKRSIRARGIVELVRVEYQRGVLRLVVRGRAVESMEPYEEEYECKLKFSWRFCDDCIQAKAGREVARVQVRAKDRSLSREEVKTVRKVVAEALESTMRRGLDLVEVVEDEGGIDLVFSSLSAAKTVVSALEREFVTDVLETRKSMGVDRSGRRRARSTFRVLLPQFRKGDVVESGGKLFYVTGIEHGVVKAIELATSRRIVLRASRALVKSSRIIVDRESLEPTMVISVGRREVQVMSLKNFNVYSIHFEKIPLWIKEGVKAYLTVIDGRYYVLPYLES